VDCGFCRTCQQSGMANSGTMDSAMMRRIHRRTSGFSVVDSYVDCKTSCCRCLITAWRKCKVQPFTVTIRHTIRPTVGYYKQKTCLSRHDTVLLNRFHSLTISSAHRHTKTYLSSRVSGAWPCLPLSRITARTSSFSTTVCIRLSAVIHFTSLYSQSSDLNCGSTCTLPRSASDDSKHTDTS